MRFSSSAAVLGVLFCLSGCDVFSSVEERVYFYTAFDRETGETLVSGYMQFRYEQTGDLEYPTRIRGTMDLKRLDGDAAVGPQVDVKEFQGYIDTEGRIWIWIGMGRGFDWNVDLRGSFSEEWFGDIEGEWVFSAIDGSVNWGRFEAKEVFSGT